MHKYIHIHTNQYIHTNTYQYIHTYTRAVGFMSADLNEEVKKGAKAHARYLVKTEKNKEIATKVIAKDLDKGDTVDSENSYNNSARSEKKESVRFEKKGGVVKIDRQVVKVVNGASILKQNGAYILTPLDNVCLQYTCIHTYVHTCIYMHTDTPGHSMSSTYIHTYIHTHTHTHTHIHR
jgi:hypothetical protein